MAASTKHKHRIFISHSHHDNVFCVRLVDDLRRALGSDDAVWYDSKGGRRNSNAGLRPGDHWRKVIDQQLLRRNVFILIYSYTAKKSGWVEYEVDEAINRAVKRKMKIITITRDSCPLPRNLTRYQCITSHTAEEYNTAFDSVLQGLGLEKEPEDPKEALVQQWINKMQWSFNDKDWKNVLEQSKLFIEKFPEVPSFQVYRMRGIALLELDNFAEVPKFINKAIARTQDDGQHIKLLDEVVPLLMAKNQWEGVKAYSDYVLEIIPTDSKWRERQKLAYTKLGPMKKQTMASTATINIPDAVTQVLNARLDATGTIPLFTSQAQATASTTANLSGGSTIPLYSTQRTNTTISLDDFSQQHLPQSQMRQMFHNKLSLACLLLDCIVLPVIFASLVHRIFAVNIITIAVLCIDALIMFVLYLYGWFIKQDWHALTLPILFGLLWSINCGCFFYIFLYQSNIFTQTLDNLTYIAFAVGVTVLLLALYCHLELFRRKK